jgi:hypothetical protein
MNEKGEIRLWSEKEAKILNRLARKFYKAMGYVVQTNYDFFNATHPQEVMVLQMAGIAYAELEKTFRGKGKK